MKKSICDVVVIDEKSGIIIRKESLSQTMKSRCISSLYIWIMVTTLISKHLMKH